MYSASFMQFPISSTEFIHNKYQTKQLSNFEAHTAIENALLAIITHKQCCMHILLYAVVNK